MTQSQADQIAYRMHEASAVQGPYIGLAVVLVLLAVFVFLFNLPALKETTETADDGRHSLLDAFNRVPESGTPRFFSSRIRVAPPFVE